MNKVIHHNTWHWGDSYTIVTHNGHVYGSIQFESNKDYSYIFSLSITEGNRLKGYGREMMINLEELSKSLGYNKVYLDVEINSGNHGFYLKLGYTIKSSTEHYYRMIKNL